jgi:hypothetical protein
VAISDINTIIEKHEQVDATFFADDGSLSCPKLDVLQRALNDLVPYLAERGLSINANKTKIIKFRRGGRQAKSDEMFLNGEKIEFVKQFNYLGVPLQVTGLCFTQHIISRARAARFAGFEIKNLSKLSLETALKLFHLKVAPMATYGIQLVCGCTSR